jgi:hypothetical protein
MKEAKNPTSRHVILELENPHPACTTEAASARRRPGLFPSGGRGNSKWLTSEPVLLGIVDARPKILPLPPMTEAQGETFFFPTRDFYRAFRMLETSH